MRSNSKVKFDEPDLSSASTQPLSGKVLAIIVTYNRKHLLLRCMQALLAQKRKVDSILIIDNHSCDGTYAHLEDNGILKVPAVEYIDTGENLGGAGGFARGLSIASDRGFSWVWMMDDDAYPDQFCFSALWQHRRHDAAMCPMCIDENDPSSLAFSAPIGNTADNSSWRTSTIVKESQNHLYNGWGAFFNGTLIPMPIIRRIGIVNPEMFIWGDEEEYRLRILRNNFSVITVTTALLNHPKERCDWVYITPKIKVIRFKKDWKHYSYYRNRGYISRKYSRTYGVLTLLLYTYYFFVIEKSISKYKFFILAWNDGFFNRYKTKLPF